MAITHGGLTLAQAWRMPWHESAALIAAANARAARTEATADTPAADDSVKADPRSKIHAPGVVRMLRMLEGQR